MGAIFLGVFILLGLIGRYTNSSTGSFSRRSTPLGPAATTNELPRKEKPSSNKVPDYITYEQTQEKRLEGVFKPDWDPWSPENRERTQALHDLIDRNRAIADAELKAEIRREKEKVPMPSVEEIMSEHEAKQPKSDPIKKDTEQTRSIWWVLDEEDEQNDDKLVENAPF